MCNNQFYSCNYIPIELHLYTRLQNYFAPAGERSERAGKIGGSISRCIQNSVKTNNLIDLSQVLLSTLFRLFTANECKM